MGGDLSIAEHDVFTETYDESNLFLYSTETTLLEKEGE
jgi:hypothetical protein